jgi:hypothetical protein
MNKTFAVIVILITAFIGFLLVNNLPSFFNETEQLLLYFIIVIFVFIGMYVIIKDMT